jgi:NAD(P)-dependent dehydrogenase (short-subunit alcohol dehydrogenase family)
MPDWLGLEGQRVVVAGGTGTIGAALVAAFIDAQASVGVLDLDVVGVHPGATAAVQVDLSDPDLARGSLNAVREQLGDLDVLVHCVGINDRKPIESYTAAEWDRILAVNLTSAFHLAAEAAMSMRNQGRGRIVFFSSVSGRSGHKLHGPYAASKGAINQLMRVIAHEYAIHGVTVNAVAPGYMETELTRRYLTDHPEKREALIELIPAGRFGSLQEVVDPVLFLCSPRASFITGQVLYIDGGRTIV